MANALLCPNRSTTWKRLAFMLPAPFFTLLASCSEPTHPSRAENWGHREDDLATATLSATAITVDGSPADWVGIPALVVDPINAGTDIRSVRVTSSGTDVYFLIEVTRATSTDQIVLPLDLDRNVATGCGGTYGDIYGTGPTQLGNEALILISPNNSVFPPIWLATPPGSDPCYFQPVGSWATVAATDSYVEASVPLSALRQVGMLSGFDLIAISGNDVTAKGSYFTSGTGVGSAAASLARSLLYGPYLWGGKGWDYTSRVFPDASIMSSVGYTYYNPSIAGFDMGKGVDCSGLVLWSYNKAGGATQELGGPIAYEGAEGQFNYNSDPINESDVSPGDLLFFDYDAGDPNPDHVAMYLGGDEVIEAYAPKVGIKLSSKNYLETLSVFRGFRRVRPATIGLLIQAHSPVDLTVTDPEGRVINAHTLIVTEREPLREIPGHLYYSEWDIDGDGTSEARVVSPVLEQGDYLIQVTPKAGVSPTAMYGLTAQAGGTSILLANNTRTSDIPPAGYGVSSSGGDVSSFLPIGIDVKPGSGSNPINSKADGLIPVAIYSAKGFDAPSDIDRATLRFGRTGQENSLANCGGAEDLNGDGRGDLVCHFSVQASGLQVGDRTAILNAQTVTGLTVKGRDTVRMLF